MELEFKYKIYLPSKSRYYYFTQLNNGVFTTLAKMIANGDDQQLESSFTKMVYNMSNRRVDPQKITRIDMFCILLNIYIVCVKNSIEMSGDEKDGIPQNIKLDLYNILDKVTNFEFDYTRHMKIGDRVSMDIRCPSILYMSDHDDLMADCIETLNIADERHVLTGLTKQQRKNILDQLPAEIATGMVEKMLEINEEYKVDVFGNDEDGNKVTISLYNNSMFEILKLIYRQSLEAQYFYKYFLAKHVRLPDVDDYTPAEIQTYMNFFRQEQEEIEKQRKSQEKENKGGTHLGGAIPGM